MKAPIINPWSTHQPLIKLCLKVFNPKFICELGIGYYSTPLFFNHPCEKIFIENDKYWIDKVDLKGERVIYHDCGVANQDVPVHDIPKKTKESIRRYYLNLLVEIAKKPGPRLLFVDNYSCCRAIAINTLYDVFDIIIYHDCEPQSIERNNYHFEFKGFNHYVLETPETWTGMFVSKKIDKRNLQSSIELEKGYKYVKQ